MRSKKDDNVTQSFKPHDIPVAEPSKSAGEEINPEASKQSPLRLKKAVRKVDDQVASFAYLTRAGRNHDKMIKQNQDNFFVVKNFAKIENLWFFGVADGHGQNGHLVSEYVKNHLALDIMDVDLHMREQAALEQARE